MNSTVTMNLANHFQVAWVNFTISAACASGLARHWSGYMFIRSGMQDCKLLPVACSGGKLPLYSMLTFDALSAFSVRAKVILPALPVCLTVTATDWYPAKWRSFTVVLESLNLPKNVALPSWLKL